MPTTEVNTDKIRNAANEAAAENEEEISWRCSCGEEFDSQDDLASHHTDTQHSGMWLIEDGTETEVEVEVDGERAVLRRGPPREEIPDKPPWKDPQIPEHWIYEAQRAIDNGEIIVGGLQSGKKCVGKQVVDGYELDCPHLTVMRSVVTNECDLQHKHTETIAQMCLVHWVRKLAAGIEPAGLGPLLEATA
jgi:hypothetical protein